jgi:hypothetical protein
VEYRPAWPGPDAAAVESREQGHARRDERGAPVRGGGPAGGGTERAAGRLGDRRDRRDRAGKAREATAGVQRQYLGCAGRGGERDQRRSRSCGMGAFPLEGGGLVCAGGRREGSVLLRSGLSGTWNDRRSPMSGYVSGEGFRAVAGGVLAGGTVGGRGGCGRIGACRAGEGAGGAGPGDRAAVAAGSPGRAGGRRAAAGAGDGPGRGCADPGRAGARPGSGQRARAGPGDPDRLPGTRRPERAPGGRGALPAGREALARAGRDGRVRGGAGIARGCLRRGHRPDRVHAGHAAVPAADPGGCG